MVAASVLVVTAAIAWQVAPDRKQVELERQSLNLFPEQLGTWRSGNPQTLDPEIEAVLGADDYYSVTFQSPEHRLPVSLFIAYYSKQTEGAGIHSPEVCVPGGGWEMSTIQRKEIELINAEAKATLGTIPVNRAMIQKGLNKQIVYYWFEGRGRKMTNDYIAKAFTLFDALTMGRTDGALVRLLTPVRQGESEEEAEERLRLFLDKFIDVMPQYIPQ